MATTPEALALALEHHQAGRLHAAELLYRQILQVEPHHADALHLLGVIAHQVGRHEAAAELIGRAISLNGNAAAYHGNLGVVFKVQGRLEEAAARFRRALELKPDYAEAHNNLGNALQDQGKLDEALACYRRALELDPGYVDAHNNLGNVLRDQGKLEEAIAAFRRAVELRPSYAASLGSVIHALQHLCRWEELKRLPERAIEIVERDGDGHVASPMLPFTFLTLPVATTAEQQLRCARQWADRQLTANSGPVRGVAYARPVAPKSKITVGYLSADYHCHATAWLIAELFEKHDRRRFAVNGYSYGPMSCGPTRQRLAAALDRFVDLKDDSFLRAAERIAADGVDILVDLKGYTKGARTEILALRPAPIQVNYLGYPGTMGADFMDYILVDDYIVPADQQPFFAEKLVHLPGCYQVNDSRREVSGRTPSREECGLPAEGFVFCSFNNSYKITPEMFDVWARLLQAVPGSVLWLLEGNRFVSANLHREAAARGVASGRLVMAPRLPLAEHLARHRLADLFLDTFPVTAHTTASDALWVGCPVLTLAGKTFVSRVAGSLLRTVGLAELVVASLEEYEATALQLARDPRKLADLRVRLEANRTACGLFDGAAFARKVESAYETMWKMHLAGERPRSFAVPVPLSLRERAGERGVEAFCGQVRPTPQSNSPHPDPLPEGEGDCEWPPTIGAWRLGPVSEPS